MVQGFFHCFQLYAHIIHKVLNGKVAFLPLPMAVENGKKHLFYWAQSGIFHNRFNHFHILAPVPLFYHLKSSSTGFYTAYNPEAFNLSIFGFPVEVVGS
jgi:hypothetical protein